MCAYFDGAEAERYFFLSFGRRAFQGRSFAELSVVAQILGPARLLGVWRHCRLLGGSSTSDRTEGLPAPGNTAHRGRISAHVGLDGEPFVHTRRVRSILVGDEVVGCGPGGDKDMMVGLEVGWVRHENLTFFSESKVGRVLPFHPPPRGGKRRPRIRSSFDSRARRAAPGKLSGVRAV